jgi:hypothetical protein
MPTIPAATFPRTYVKNSDAENNQYATCIPWVPNDPVRPGLYELVTITDL